MRLYLKLLKNKSAISYNYQHLMTGCIHKWLGEKNLEHGSLSLYSFSWFQNTKASSQGLWLTADSYVFMNFYSSEMAKTVVKGMLAEPEMFNGIRVTDIMVKETPFFEPKETFIAASPILIKRSKDDKEKHYTFSDNEANAFMTETLKTKLKVAGLSNQNISVRFDDSYGSPKTKLINYKGIKNKANLCPVIIEGSPEQIGFAWNVGIGNSTGIGFGALK